VGIFTTYKRFVLVLAIFIVWLFWVQHIKKFAIVKGKVFSFFALLIGFMSIFMLIILFAQNNKLFQVSEVSVNVHRQVFDLSTHMLEIFSPIYWQRTLNNSRGWSILVLAPRLLASRFGMFGLSPDESYMRQTIYHYFPDLGKIIAYEALEDAFWIAMIAYYGLMGIILFFYIILKLYQVTRKAELISLNPLCKEVSKIFSIYIIAYVVLGFVYRVPEIRTTSLFFWLMAGLLYRLYLQNRSVMLRDTGS
jgi:hypothetical protein